MNISLIVVIVIGIILGEICYELICSRKKKKGEKLAKSIDQLHNTEENK